MDKEHPKNAKLQAETFLVDTLSFLSSTGPHLNVVEMDKKLDFGLMRGPSAQSLKRLFLV